MWRPVLAPLLLAWALATWTAAMAAATGPAEAPAWMKVQGHAVALSVGGDGAVFALDERGGVWLRRPGLPSSWSALPGAFQRIAAVSEKRAWAVGEGGETFSYDGTWWRPMGERFPVEAVDIGASVNNVVFVIASSGRLVLLDPGRGVVEVPDAPGDLARVSVDDRDLPWVVDRSGRVFRLLGGRWVALDQRARELAAGNGGVWLIGQDDAVIGLDHAGALREAAGRAAAIASAPGGKPWVATADGHIYAREPNSAPGRGIPRVEREQVFTRLLNWKRVRGHARQIAISPKGAVLALGPAGEVWHWRGRDDWGRLPGSFDRVALDVDNVPWGIAADGAVMRYQGTYWQTMPGRARDITAGADGSVWALGMDGTPARWRDSEHRWIPLAYTPDVGIARIAIAGDGSLWCIDKAGAVVRFSEERWESLPELKAIDVATGPEGSVFVVGADQRLWRWDGAGKRWERLNGEARGVAVGPLGKPWIVTPEQGILASAFFDDLPDNKVDTVSRAAANAAQADMRPQAGTLSGLVGQPGSGATAPKARGDETLLFQKVVANARDISIGADGSVFIVTFDGGLARWSNTRGAFASFPGQISRVAVAPDGKPWGVTPRGEIYRHDGGDWRWVPNINAQDIAIGFNGTVVVSGPQDFLYRFDAASNSFVRLPAADDGTYPAGLRLAVDPFGRAWVVRRDGFVARCDRSPCEILKVKARDIAIGPEGSIFIIDEDHRMRRWNERQSEFERLAGIVDLADVIAVGPLGKPWLVSTQAEVWASEFFRRDESKDVTTAAGSASNTSSSGTPVFTFLANMSFDKVTLPAGFLYNPWPTVRMAIGKTGSPVIIDSSYVFWNYDEVAKKLVRDVSLPSPASKLLGDSLSGFVIGKDGSYWLAKYGPPSQVFRREGAGWVAVAGLADCVGCGGALPISLTVAPDGEIHATSEAGYLYRYDRVLLRFVKLPVPLPDDRVFHVAIDPNGRYWATTLIPPATFKLHENQGGVWTRRDDGTTGSLGWCLSEGMACVSIGANGSVYSYSNTLGKLVRWSPSLRAWEIIATSPDPVAGGDYLIARDGRPWVFQQVMSGAGPGLYRAR